MKPSYRFYRRCYHLARTAIGIFYRIQVFGYENIPDNAAMVCANHSSGIDPFFVAFAFGINHHMHVIAKVELFRIPVIAPILKKLGMISVNRGVVDASTIKSSFGYLKNNEKVVIFPEGTRVSKDDAIAAKTGAVKIAEHAGVPLIPMYIPRKKPLFSRVTVVIGEPYYIEKQEHKRVLSDYSQLSDVLMDKIKLLNPEQLA